MEQLTQQIKEALEQLLDVARLSPGDILIIGCSTSEVGGQSIGTDSNVEIAQALWQGIAPIAERAGIYVAAQCCEHLNRAVILEREAAQRYGYEVVNIVPQKKAGGSFATVTYANLSHPVAVESVRASAGMDIGGTLIGMHLKAVAVPVRVSQKTIGEANLICARTRPKFIGGSRAVYDESLL